MFTRITQKLPKLCTHNVILIIFEGEKLEMCSCTIFNYNFLFDKDLK